MPGFLNIIHCDRCGENLTVRTMSMMNEDIICNICKEEERNHPFYEKARAAEEAAVKKGNYNYKGFYNGRKYPFLECSVEGCNHKELLSELDTGTEKMFFCTQHLLMYVIAKLTPYTVMFNVNRLKKYPSTLGKENTCVLCGDNAMRLKDVDAKYILCGEHMKSLVLKNLTPAQWEHLSCTLGNTYYLHEDFYDQNGNALQPITMDEAK